MSWVRDQIAINKSGEESNDLLPSCLHCWSPPELPALHGPGLGLPSLLCWSAILLLPWPRESHSSGAGFGDLGPGLGRKTIVSLGSVVGVDFPTPGKCRIEQASRKKTIRPKNRITRSVQGQAPSRSPGPARSYRVLRNPTTVITAPVTVAEVERTRQTVFSQLCRGEGLSYCVATVAP